MSAASWSWRVLKNKKQEFYKKGMSDDQSHVWYTCRRSHGPSAAVQCQRWSLHDDNISLLGVNSPKTHISSGMHWYNTGWWPCRAPLYWWPRPSLPWVGQPWPSVLECLSLRLLTWSPATIWVRRDTSQMRIKVNLQLRSGCYSVWTDLALAES